MERVQLHQAPCVLALVRPQDLLLQRSTVPRLPQALLRGVGPWVLAAAVGAPDGLSSPYVPVLASDQDLRTAWRLGRAADTMGEPLAAGRLLLLHGGDPVDVAPELVRVGLPPDLAHVVGPQVALGLRVDGQAVLLAAPRLRLGELAPLLVEAGCRHAMSLGFGSTALLLGVDAAGGIRPVVGDAANFVEALLTAQHYQAYS